jgi:hypothetical protein
MRRHPCRCPMGMTRPPSTPSHGCSAPAGPTSTRRSMPTTTPTYVSEVLELAQTVAAGTAGGIAVDWALAQVGTPCISGGETPGVGLDCSGLVQAANKGATGFGSHDVASDRPDPQGFPPAGGLRAALTALLVLGFSEDHRVASIDRYSTLISTPRTPGALLTHCARSEMPRISSAFRRCRRRPLLCHGVSEMDEPV